MEAFVNSDPKLKIQFGEVIPRLNILYDEVIKFAPRNLWYDYIYNLTPVLKMASIIDNYRNAYGATRTDSAKKEFLTRNKKNIFSDYSRLYSQYNLAYEKSALKKMFQDAKLFNSDNNVKSVSEFFKEVKDENGLSKKIDNIYKKSKFADEKFIKNLIDKDLLKLFKLNDPLLRLASSLNEEINFYDNEDAKRNSEINLLMTKYVEAKSIWKSKQFIPDANSTLRFTYGFVRGYSPDDAVYLKPFTTLRGVIQKEDGKDYELLPLIKELYAAKDFGAYALPDSSDIPVDFLYNLDTTGGNSGSPVLDSEGELVGVNFDRAYTATINDYAWNETYSRSVGVDIRYVFWILQKVAHAQFILDEMNKTPN
ncbi:MAG: S46 family peptidase [Bacteroidia bacterium]